MKRIWFCCVLLQLFVTIPSLLGAKKSICVGRFVFHFWRLYVTIF